MKKLWLSVIVVSAFIGGYGAVADAFPAAGIYGRAEYRGYFSNIADSAGTDVLPREYQSGTEAMPSSINSATEFINFIMDKYNNGNSQERTGAAFIMSTMLELNGNSDRSPNTSAWAEVVRTAVNHGHVTWRANFSYSINSYYQGPSGGGATNDDAFYDNSGTFPAMIFEDEYGRITYVLKWQCANPVGTPTTFNTYSLEQPWNISATSYVVNSAGDDSRNAPVGQISTYVGDTLNWTHRVLNTGSFTNPTQVDSWSAQAIGGPFSTVTPRFTIGVMGAGASHTYSDAPYVVPNFPVGTNICRTAFYNPASSSSNADERSAGHCAVVEASYDLEPTINVQVNGGAAAGNRAEAGDTVTFTYAVNNTGGNATNIGCTIYGLTRNGYYALPGTPDNTSDPGFVQPAHGCPRNFPGSTNTTLVTETIPAAQVIMNRSICRSLYVASATPGGSPLGIEACAYVVRKPYIRAYGSDVVTGMGYEDSSGSCSTTDDAAIIGWNRGAASAWAGAGTQHAALGTGRIFDFASSLGGAAGPPTALSFRNDNTASGSGNFGGDFDWAPCMPDYYGERPASTLAIPVSIASMNTGDYGGSGNVTLGGGGLAAGERITVYVDGNLMLNSNIVYGGSWTIDQMPLLKVVVRGDIFIDRAATQLDGLFIAQPTGAGTGGGIYTCVYTDFVQPPLTNNLATQCGSKLTINGALIGRDVRLLRTTGTLRQSAAGEANTSANIAEVINYGPHMWSWQPPSTDSGATYDAITSLPPIL